MSFHRDLGGPSVETGTTGNPSRRPSRRGQGRCAPLVRVAILALALSFRFLPSFVAPPRTGARGHLLRAAAAGSGTSAKDDDVYEWQKVSEPATDAQKNIKSISDLPDPFELAAEAESPSPDGVRSIKARVREVELPDIPGMEDDLYPPGPNPWTEGGLGLMQWTGTWLVFAIVIALGFGGLSLTIGKIQMTPELAIQLTDFVRVVGTFSAFVFGGRSILSLYPQIKADRMPYAPVYYATEWILAPTRMVFQPEAGVDIAPIFWLAITLLVSELLTGPSGILTVIRDAPLMGMPVGFSK